MATEKKWMHVIAWAIVTLCTGLFRSDVFFTVFHFPKFLSSPSWTGMGSGGSVGKEAGPLKALLRQQTQSALEQRVRKRHIHMHLYIHNQVYAQKCNWWLWVMFLRSVILSLDFRGFHHPLKRLLEQGYVGRGHAECFLIVESFMFPKLLPVWELWTGRPASLLLS